MGGGVALSALPAVLQVIAVSVMNGFVMPTMTASTIVMKIQLFAVHDAVAFSASLYVSVPIVVILFLSREFSGVDFCFFLRFSRIFGGYYFQFRTFFIPEFGMFTLCRVVMFETLKTFSIND